MTDPKISTGPNDRPKDETIAQTGAGLPDDSGHPVEVDEQEAARIEENIRRLGTEAPQPELPYDVSSASGTEPAPAKPDGKNTDKP
ncbi:MAG TPA: hypothetical protein VFE52_00680 [Devosia sp.]|jgi:hypothetical protein|nr:hypothetical protein [Devosia sp.]